MDNPMDEPKRTYKDKKVKPLPDAKYRKSRTAKNVGVTKKEFYAILDKASQPVKHEAQSDSEKTET